MFAAATTEPCDYRYGFRQSAQGRGPLPAVVLLLFASALALPSAEPAWLRIIVNTAVTAGLSLTAAVGISVRPVQAASSRDGS